VTAASLETLMHYQIDEDQLMKICLSSIFCYGIMVMLLEQRQISLLFNRHKKKKKKIQLLLQGVITETIHRGS
jgi:hypothetical protein